MKLFLVVGYENILANILNLACFRLLPMLATFSKDQHVKTLKIKDKIMSIENSRKSIEQEIRIKSLKDHKFRQQLLANPKSAIEAAIGINIPENLNIIVIEELVNHVILTIPPKLSDSDELSEEQLGAVAGGMTKLETYW